MALTNKKYLYLLLISFIAVLVAWYAAVTHAPADAQQGMVYKIIFIHVPAAACALGVCSLGMLISSLLGLAKPEERFLRANRAWVEIGLLFTVLTLMTGSIWGRPTWGTWWTWDPRLTTTLLLAILQFAFLLLYNSLPAGRQRIRILSMVGIIIFLDVPIIYKSVEWWRTLHQPASLIESRGSTMDPEMLRFLIVSLVFLSIFSIALWALRTRNLKMKSILEDAAFAAMKG